VPVFPAPVIVDGERRNHRPPVIPGRLHAEYEMTPRQPALHEVLDDVHVAGSRGVDVPVVAVAIGITTDQGRYVVVVADQMILDLRIPAFIVVLSREGYADPRDCLSVST